MRLDDDRYEYIKQVVADLFVQYKIDCIPINCFEIARKMGIKVVPFSKFNKAKRDKLYNLSEDGFCVEKTLGEWYIFYNDEKNPGRINNTIMHEIGHIVLDYTEDSELAEAEVKFFAKYALAPPILVDQLSVIDEYTISKKFNLSLEAGHYAHKYYNQWLKYGKGANNHYDYTIWYLFNIIT